MLRGIKKDFDNMNHWGRSFLVYNARKLRPYGFPMALFENIMNKKRNITFFYI